MNVRDRREYLSARTAARASKRPQLVYFGSRARGFEAFEVLPSGGVRALPHGHPAR